MRIQCTFNLAPELHEQHRFTVENLRAWQTAEKLRNDDKDIAQQRRSIFHRDIYLSGLYLYQLSSELPKLVSEQYKADNIDASRLTKQIALIAPHVDESGTVNVPAGDPQVSLAESQWQKMAQLLEAHQQQILAEQKVEREAEAQAHETLAHEKQLAATELLTEQLSSMQQQQTQLLERIEQADTQAKQPAVSGSGIKDVEPLLAQNQGELLQVIEANQALLVSAFDTLKRQVGQMSRRSNTLEESPSQIDIEKAALSSQLQRASKVKSKGLW